MAQRRIRASRRSFLAQVAGAGAAFGASGWLSGAAAQSRSWSARDATCRSGVTDVDSGSEADEAGNGRGSGSAGITDSDEGGAADPAGHGRGTGFSDSDSGETADRAGYGRGSPDKSESGGVTDSDSGSQADPSGAGRGRERLTDVDTGWGADPIGRGQGGARLRPVPEIVCEAAPLPDEAP